MGREEASFSLCKTLGSFLFLCILLAILYPVWEFQEHLRLSFAQPHMCKPKGSVVFLPAGALSLAVNCAVKRTKPGRQPHLRDSPSLPHPAQPGTQRPSPLSCTEKRQGSEGLLEQPKSSDQTDGTFLTQHFPCNPRASAGMLAGVWQGQGRPGGTG